MGFLPASDAFCKASVSPRFDAACIVFRFEWRFGRVLPCRPRRSVGPCVRMRDGGSNANDSTLYTERDFLGFPQQQKGLGPGRRAGRPRNGASGLLRQPRQHGHVRRVLHPRHGGLHEAADHRDGAVLPPRDRRPGRRLVPDRPGHARVSLHGRFFPP